MTVTERFEEILAFFKLFGYQEGENGEIKLFLGHSGTIYINGEPVWSMND